MSENLAAWFPVLRPHLSTDLVEDEAFHRLQSLARNLPGDVMGVFEIRLAQGRHPVDFSIRLQSPTQANTLAHRLPAPHLQHLFETGWENLGFPEPVESLWLEFDDATIGAEFTGQNDGEPLPYPVVCARLKGKIEPEWLISRLLPALHGLPLTEFQRESLRDCLANIPQGWHVLYAFSLRSRPHSQNAVRLELFGHDLESMHNYVHQLISTDAANRLEELSELYRGCDRYHLSFDISESEISPRVGVEYAYARLPKDEPRWPELFDRLVENGYCTEEKRAAVLKWPGYDTIWTSASRWPSGGRGYVVRGLSHLKVIVKGSEAIPNSKNYLIVEASRGSDREAIQGRWNREAI